MLGSWRRWTRGVVRYWSGVGAEVVADIFMMDYSDRPLDMGLRL